MTWTSLEKKAMPANQAFEEKKAYCRLTLPKGGLFLVQKNSVCYWKFSPSTRNPLKELFKSFDISLHHRSGISVCDIAITVAIWILTKKARGRGFINLATAPFPSYVNKYKYDALCPALCIFIYIYMKYIFSNALCMQQRETFYIAHIYFS